MDDKADRLLGKKEPAIESQDGKLRYVDAAEVDELDCHEVFGPHRQFVRRYFLQIYFVMTDSSIFYGACAPSVSSPAWGDGILEESGNCLTDTDTSHA